MRTALASLVRGGRALFSRRKGSPCRAHRGEKACKCPVCVGGLFALVGLPCGVCCVVKSIELTHEKAEDLRRVGIREGCRISLLGAGDPVVVQVHNSRIAISRRLAGAVRVRAASH
ncbi:MAG: ferrous iron transport protein A [Verrucomicrobiae bacterium]|nr:ferrous iron transport protein A [Verrucomicrobiae bacterium]